jgi:hypothetical protein
MAEAGSDIEQGSGGLRQPAHTPGPWRIANCDVHPTESDAGRRFLEVRAGDDTKSPYEAMVSGFIDCGGTSVCMIQSDNREADARLIVVAPDMLKRLIALVTPLDTADPSAVVDVLGDDGWLLVRDAKAAIARATGTAL